MKRGHPLGRWVGILMGFFISLPRLMHAQSAPYLVKDINAGPSPFFKSDPKGITPVGDTTFFTAETEKLGRELWKTDGTGTGTQLVKDIAPLAAGSFPVHLTNVNGTLFFVADDGTHGGVLRRSDGTEVGTLLVKDISPGTNPPNVSPRFLTNFNGTLFFTANDGSTGTELWKSDGTEAGTMLVKDVAPGAAYSFPQFLTVVGDTLFFIESGRLWKSDGTTDGTILVNDVQFRDGPTSLVNANGMLFFVADDGIHGRELWKSDGTQAGTSLVKDINPGAAGGFGLFSCEEDCSFELAEVNGTIF